MYIEERDIPVKPLFCMTAFKIDWPRLGRGIGRSVLSHERYPPPNFYFDTPAEMIF